MRAGPCRRRRRGRRGLRRLRDHRGRQRLDRPHPGARRGPRPARTPGSASSTSPGPRGSAPRCAPGMPRPPGSSSSTATPTFPSTSRRWRGRSGCWSTRRRTSCPPTASIAPARASCAPSTPWSTAPSCAPLFGLRLRDVNFSFKLFRRALLERIDLKSTGQLHRRGVPGAGAQRQRPDHPDGGGLLPPDAGRLLPGLAGGHPGHSPGDGRPGPGAVADAFATRPPPCTIEPRDADRRGRHVRLPRPCGSSPPSARAATCRSAPAAWSRPPSSTTGAWSSPPPTSARTASARRSSTTGASPTRSSSGSPP